MSTTQTSLSDTYQEQQDSGSDSYLTTPKGITSWLLTRDHKRIGLMFLAAISVFFIVGGLLALLVRLELLTPGETIVGPDTYNQLFTLHGTIMVFLFLIPAAPAVLGNFVLPLMIGAKDVAFPRLNLASFYVFMTGALVVVGSVLWGGLDTGWIVLHPLCH